MEATARKTSENDRKEKRRRERRTSEGSILTFQPKELFRT